MMRHLLQLTPLAVMLVVGVACNASVSQQEIDSLEQRIDHLESAVLVTPSPISMGTPPPRWSEEAIRVSIQIKGSLADAERIAELGLAASLDPRTVPADVLDSAAERALEACERLQVLVPSDLWPHEYRSHHEEFASVCLLLMVRASSGEIWFPEGRRARLDEVTQALPDYSDAQLRDAIEARR